jgi:hypothetical protein
MDWIAKLPVPDGRPWTGPWYAPPVIVECGADFPPVLASDRPSSSSPIYLPVNLEGGKTATALMCRHKWERTHYIGLVWECNGSYWVLRIKSVEMKGEVSLKAQFSSCTAAEGHEFLFPGLRVPGGNVGLAYQYDSRPTITIKDVPLPHLLQCMPIEGSLFDVEERQPANEKYRPELVDCGKLRAGVWQRRAAGAYVAMGQAFRPPAPIRLLAQGIAPGVRFGDGPFGG